MLEWILIIAVLAAIFFAKDLPAVKDKAVDLGKVLLQKAKEKKDQIAAEKQENKTDKE